MSSFLPSFIQFPLPAFIPRKKQPDVDLEQGVPLDELSSATDSFGLSSQETNGESSRANQGNAAGQRTHNNEISVRDKRTHLVERDKRNEVVVHGKHRIPLNDEEENFYSNYYPGANFNSNKSIAEEYRQHRLRVWDPENYVPRPEPARQPRLRWDLATSMVNRLNRSLFLEVPANVYANLMSFMPNSMLSNIPDEPPARNPNRVARGKAIASPQLEELEDGRYIDEYGTARAPLNPFFQEKPRTMVQHEIDSLAPELDIEYTNIKPMKSVQDWLDAHPNSGATTGAEFAPEVRHTRTRAQIREMAKNDPELKKELRKHRIRQFLGILPTILVGAALSYTLIKVGNSYTDKDHQIAK